MLLCIVVCRYSLPSPSLCLLAVGLVPGIGKKSAHTSTTAHLVDEVTVGHTPLQ